MTKENYRKKKKQYRNHQQTVAPVAKDPKIVPASTTGRLLNLIGFEHSKNNQPQHFPLPDDLQKLIWSYLDQAPEYVAPYDIDDTINKSTTVGFAIAGSAILVSYLALALACVNKQDNLYFRLACFILSIQYSPVIGATAGCLTFLSLFAKDTCSFAKKAYSEKILAPRIAKEMSYFVSK